MPVHDWSSHSSDAMRTLAMGLREYVHIDKPPPVIDTWARAFARANREDVADWRVA